MWTDFRFAARLLRKNPGFTAAAALTLAVGIGLNATLFSILNFLLLKPIPGANAESLVWIAGASSGPTRVPERFTLPDVLDFGAAAGPIADVLAFGEVRMVVRAGSTAVRAEGHVVTPNYFTMLGVGAAAGRLFSGADNRSDGETPVVISHGLSQQLFATPADAVNAAVEINGLPLRIVGVAQSGFTGPDVLSPVQVWVPMAAASSVAGMGSPQSRTMWWLRAMARLAPDASVMQAQAAVDGVARSIAATYADSHKDFAVRLVAARGVGPHDRGALGVLAVLPAVPVTILLIACANVAGLLLARGISRSREMAVRRALGASARQIVRQLLAETVLLSLLGGAGALLLLLWSPEILVRLIGAPISGNLSPDGRVVLFTLALSVGTALLCGLAPALRTARAGATSSLRGTPGAAEGRASTRLHRGLVVGQLALSLVLLSAAGLFVQSLQEAAKADVGFQTDGRVTLSMDLEMQRYTREQSEVFYRSLMERVSAAPGIRAASYATYIPLGGRLEFTAVYPPGQPVDPDQQPPMTGFNRVGARFFDTFEMPIVRGRGLEQSDMRVGSNVLVVNETFVHRFCGGTDPIGQRFHLEAPNRPAREIVGVVRDVVNDEPGEDARPFVYVPHDGRSGEVALIAWAGVDPATALSMLQGLVRETDPRVAVFEPRTMTQHLADRMDGERGQSRIFAVAGVLALGLAAFGLYGVIAYTVSRQTREIGVRMALGARTRDVARLFLSDGARLAALGIAVGLLPALGAGVALSGALFGLHPADIRAMIAAAAILAAAALFASYFPARRAMRVDPMVALRTE